MPEVEHDPDPLRADQLERRRDRVDERKDLGLRGMDGLECDGDAGRLARIRDRADAFANDVVRVAGSGQEDDADGVQRRESPHARTQRRCCVDVACYCGVTRRILREDRLQKGFQRGCVG